MIDPLFPMTHFMKKVFFSILSFCTLCANAATLATDGSRSDVVAKIAAASSDDVVTIPAGSFTWASTVTVNKAITLRGASEATTTITLGSGAVVAITATARVSYMSIQPPAGGWTIMRSGGKTARGAVLEHVTILNSTGNTIYWEAGGLINYVTMNTNGGEGIWTTADGGTGGYAAQNAVWAAADTAGTSDPDILTVENCTINGNGGYISDFGYGSKVVFRFNVITGIAKLDVHGCETTYRSARQIEAYGNRWTYAAEAYCPMMDLRGGRMYVFNNRSEGIGYNWMNIHSYGYEVCAFGGSDHAYAPLLNHQYWTPFNYPAPDQPGNGPDVRVGGAAPSYVFNNYNNKNNIPQEWKPGFGQVGGGTLTTNSAGYAVGATSVTITAFSDGPNTPKIGTAIQFAGDSTYYVCTGDPTLPGVLSFLPGLVKALPASQVTVNLSAIIQYQYQTGNPSATFTGADMIKSDRDIFLTATSFDGSSGVGTGTKAQMQAITPKTVGVGYWVTDEGTWNTENVMPGTPGYQKGQGQLYTWNGSTWVLKYTPNRYPHLLTIMTVPHGATTKSTPLP